VENGRERSLSSWEVRTLVLPRPIFYERYVTHDAGGDRGRNFHYHELNAVLNRKRLMEGLESCAREPEGHRCAAFLDFAEPRARAMAGAPAHLVVQTRAWDFGADLDRSPKAAPRVYVAARAPAAALRRASLDDDDDGGAPAPPPALDAAAVLGGLGAERFVDDLVDLGGGELLPRLADDCFVDDGGAVLAPRPADDAAVLVEDWLVDLDAGGPLLLAADDADRVGD